MIAIGDIVTNDRGSQARITEVHKGKCGILVYGEFTPDGELYGTYFPYELVPATKETIFGETPEMWLWGYTTLPSGVRLGSVAWECHGPRTKETIAITVEELDERWSRTSLPAYTSSGSISLEELMDRRSDHK
ncbi:hypothetical protein LCGC14_0316700 [marine sediment metagenome]|uniref:Uncharacterized protein n=1 Tax=marine sediment metagenome TaxID=412755 RepID=A0A0F9WSH9_9ZZZZ